MNPLEYWNPEGFEISSYKYSLKERINQTYTTSGKDNTGKCIYTYNELGFRGDSIKKEGFKVMSLGCSITEGVGVNDDETWPAQFCSYIENGVNFNFGTGGRSNDFICRCLMSYYDLIKPDLVLIMYTFPHRREIYTEDNGIEPYIPTNVWGKLAETEEGKIIQSSMDILQNKNADFINWYKNHMLIKLFLESKKCNWLWDGKSLLTKHQEFNRFDILDNFKMDLGSDNLHPGPKHHNFYGKKLFEHIKTNFRNYLPKELTTLKQNLI
jgi:lysophospholipase L1-like esterase